MTEKLPISALVPTRNRSATFVRTLHSLTQQSVQPIEMIVIDGSTDDSTETLCKSAIPGLVTRIRYYRATEVGAATQRHQAIAHATQNVIWLMDDDILLEPECLARLWTALQSDATIGGVSAMITNQRYSSPGWVSRSLFRFLHGHSEVSYAGKCIGPALNLLPEDHPDLPEIVPVEWLNTTCTLYRREALPNPLFPECFTGYSLMEDVTLSLTVGKRWKLTNARTARIFHDSQPGDHKNNHKVLSKMHFVNRHYVMTRILERRSRMDYFKFSVLQLFEVIATSTSARSWQTATDLLLGKWEGVQEILFKG
jgi:glycosyltransferase involved in cell wall biosynthesis